MDGKEELMKILEEAIRFENNAMDLYRLFMQIYPSDKNFWLKLSQEEKHHAGIMEGFKKVIGMGALPEGILLPDIQMLEEANSDVQTAIGIFQLEAPSMSVGYNYALTLETSAAEAHFQKNLAKQSDNKIAQKFKEMAGLDKDHAKRIKIRMKALGIEAAEQ